MSVAKTIEITARSPRSFDEAMSEGITKAAETVDEVKQAWVMGHKLIVADGKITGYQVDLKVTFVVQ